MSNPDSSRPGEAEALADTFPALRDAQAVWLGQIDSLTAPDRKTHELIRLACSVALRHRPGIERHAMLAAEFGATWEDIAGTLVLTQPSFGLVPSREALPVARAGYERGYAVANGGVPDAGGAAGDPD